MYKINEIRKVMIDKEDDIVYVVANSYLNQKGIYVL